MVSRRFLHWGFGIGSSDLFAVVVNSEILVTSIDLNIPVIRNVRVRAVFDPYSSLNIGVAFFAFFWSICQYVLFDDRFSSSVRRQLWFERMSPARGQSGLLDLVYYLLRKVIRHPGPRLRPPF